ncbi:unnamed protein product, partial [Amoebophrya sp. A120]
ESFRSIDKRLEEECKTVENPQYVTSAKDLALAKSHVRNVVFAFALQLRAAPPPRDDPSALRWTELGDVLHMAMTFSSVFGSIKKRPANAPAAASGRPVMCDALFADEKKMETFWTQYRASPASDATGKQRVYTESAGDLILEAIAVVFMT